MKLLVLAQTPPPLHGQSLMVQTAVDGLPEHGVEVHHVNLRLSRSHADIGGWRVGKMLAVLDACFHAVVARFVHGCDTLYYVPAPAKRGALYRDWIVMALCRPFFRKLVLHFHNGGLGEWIAQRLTAPERALTRLLLGRADLAIVLADALRGDAEALFPHRIACVPNGIADPAPQKSTTRPRQKHGAATRVLFLGLCSDEKGVFDLLAAVDRANRESPGAIELDVAGAFPDAVTAARFKAALEGRTDVRYHGFAGGALKDRLLVECDCLCLATRYPHEAQPLVLLEALAHDRAIVATRWRAIAETVGGDAGELVEPGNVEQLANALLKLHRSPLQPGVGRSRFEATYSRDHHLAQLANALRAL